jgi:hypothetical protein
MPKAIATKNQIKKSYQEMRQVLKENKVAARFPAPQGAEAFSIEAEIARREKITNDELEQDRKLKKLSLFLLFIILAAETSVIFYLAYQQGLQNDFRLEEWSFKLLITATIAQITIMLQVAIKYLFTSKKGKE